MRNSLFLAAVASSLFLTGVAAQAALITESGTAPSSAAISQPDFSAPAFNGSQDFSDNGGPPGQTFTAAANLSLTSVAVKGFANTGGSFGGFPATFTISINSVNGTTLTQLDQETTASFNPANGADYLTFTLATPVALTGGAQYEYDIYSSTGFFGFAKSTTDVYAGGAAMQNGSSSRTSTTGSSITNTQADDRTFFINPVNTPEPASIGLLAMGAIGLLARRRR